MTAVGQVKRAVSAAIKAAGCAAIESYSEEQLKRYATAVAAVGTKETVIEESGAIEYLGEKVDEATQETVFSIGKYSCRMVHPIRSSLAGTLMGYP